MADDQVRRDERQARRAGDPASALAWAHGLVRAGREAEAAALLRTAPDSSEARSLLAALDDRWRAGSIDTVRQKPRVRWSVAARGRELHVDPVGLVRPDRERTTVLDPESGETLRELPAADLVAVGRGVAFLATPQALVGVDLGSAVELHRTTWTPPVARWRMDQASHGGGVVACAGAGAVMGARFGDLRSAPEATWTHSLVHAGDSYVQLAVAPEGTTYVWLNRVDLRPNPVIALDAQGRERWRVTRYCLFQVLPLPSGVLVRDHQGAALISHDGETLWSTDESLWVRASSEVAGWAIATDERDRLVWIDLTRGVVTARCALADALFFAVAEDVTYAAGPSLGLAAVDSTGRILWRLEPGELGGVAHGLAPGPGRLFVEVEGRVLCLEEPGEAPTR